MHNIMLHQQILSVIIMHSYYTDNGACYYHTPGSKYSNYEDVLVAVKKDADDNGIPFRYVQVGPLYNNSSTTVICIDLYSEFHICMYACSWIHGGIIKALMVE